MQLYEAAGKAYTVEKGNYIIIFPDTMHKCVFTEDGTRKLALTFGAEIGTGKGCFCAETDPQVINNFEIAKKESAVIPIQTLILQGAIYLKIL